MKSSKEAARVAKKLFKACLVDDQLDDGKVRTVTAKLVEAKPRGYLKLLNAFLRLVRLKVESNRAVIESATGLDETTREQVVGDLQKKYGDRIEAEFRENPDLIAGMRIRVGSDVWDGSVKDRVERLAEKFN